MIAAALCFIRYGLVCSSSIHNATGIGNNYLGMLVFVLFCVENSPSPLNAIINIHELPLT